MENKEYKVQPSDIVFAILIVFCSLKFTGEISWSWWEVSAVLWVPYSIGAVWAVIYVLVEFVGESIKNLRGKNGR